MQFFGPFKACKAFKRDEKKERKNCLGKPRTNPICGSFVVVMRSERRNDSLLVFRTVVSKDLCQSFKKYRKYTMVGGGIPAQIMLQLTFQLVLWGLVKEYASLTSSWLCNQINANSLGDRESLNGIIAYTRTTKKQKHAIRRRKPTFKSNFRNKNSGPDSWAGQFIVFP